MLETLSTLTSSIPQWKASLDRLNDQIYHRQIELARLEENERPPTRSIKNKGSTESLRPRDSHENPFLSHDSATSEYIQLNPFDTPKSNDNEFTSSPQSSPATPVRTPSKSTPAPKMSPKSRPSPVVQTRQTSHPTPPTHNRPSPVILRKRKTDSIASAESQAPKYRTRSMIIVYYDKAVQDAFEDLVKFVSGSRNVIRKGKMAAKMAAMKRAAELEVGEGEDNGNDEDPHGTSVPGRMTASAPVTPQPKTSSAPTEIGVMDDEPDFQIPKLKFISTRNMGPTRDRIRPDLMGSSMSVGLLQGYRRAGGDGAPSIFDEVDKGLEWCQAQCEHAAHQFLRDGDCSTEIGNIKSRLDEVKGTAEREIEKLKKEEATGPHEVSRMVRSPRREEPRSLQLKSPLMRKEIDTSKGLQADDMEVDDEGVDDLEPPMKLVFKRSKDIVP